jgi:outer membrane protein assembly factor BamD
MRRALVLFAVLFLATCSGTKSKNTDQGFLADVGAMTKEQVMERGDALAAKKKWDEARKYYSFLADSFPNDPLGRKAALKVADTFYDVGGLDSLTEAQLRYKDFANRFPNDPNRAYALLMLGKVSYSQQKGPMRDLTSAREATTSLKQLVQLFPKSPYAKEGQELLSQCNEELAQHEYLIAKFYSNIGAWQGAKQRLDYLYANYPDTETAKAAAPLMEKVNQQFQGPTIPPPAPTPAGKTATQH